MSKVRITHPDGKVEEFTADEEYILDWYGSLSYSDQVETSIEFQEVK